MIVSEFIDLLSKYDPKTEVQAVKVEGYKFEGNTDEPIIDRHKDKKGVDWIVIRA